VCVCVCGCVFPFVPFVDVCAALWCGGAVVLWCRSVDRYVTQLHTTVLSNLSHIGELLELKDVHFNRIKADLVSQMVARRRQERKIANTQVVLKFMFDKNARLSSTLRDERDRARCVVRARCDGWGGDVCCVVVWYM